MKQNQDSKIIEIYTEHGHAMMKKPDTEKNFLFTNV